MRQVKKLLVSFVVIVIIAVGTGYIQRSFADDTPTPTPNSSDTPTPTPGASQSQISDIQTRISQLQSQVDSLKSQEQSLSSQIKVMDGQISLTQLRMNETQAQLDELASDIKTANSKITNLEGSLDKITKVLITRIRATYQSGGTPPVEMLISSNDLSDYLARASYLKITQEHDKQLVYDTQQARIDYQNQKNIFEDKQKKIEALKSQLEDYQQQLDQEQQSKKNLLADTQGSEANYERLLAQAKAQLAGFSSFAASQGGASLLSGQTVCDDWGCYYNQRDTQWGALALNGSAYSIASDGCLMTDMAMVYTHYGHKDVTPVTINSDPSNFASYYAAYLKYSISANGVSASRVGISMGDIDGELAAGRPVIVGISYDSGPLADHFVVLVSGSNGNYMMNDPFTPNGHNIPFTSHYSLGSIREIDKVVM